MKDWAGVKDWKKEDWSWKKKVDWAKFGAAKKGCMGRMDRYLLLTKNYPARHSN